jgi:D-3-phosphoglycerate dehydrogenase
MNSKLILHIDENHPLLIKGLERLGYENHIAYTTALEDVLKLLPKYSGIVIRSRFPIDKNLIDCATNLKFIARVGAGLENIDIAYAQSKKIALIAAPEGNRNAVGEHVLGMLLSLMNKLRQAHTSIQKGAWLREDHRGFELEGKTIGIIGYGNTGKSFAKKLFGFEVEVICYDIKAGVGDQNAKQVSLEELQDRAQVISLHIPQTTETNGMIDKNFIDRVKNPFWFLNSARGKAVRTTDLVEGLRSKKILGAALDVLEYESSSFHSIFGAKNRPETLDYLLNSDAVLLSPHVAGWTFESHIKLAQTIVDKVAALNL